MHVLVWSRIYEHMEKCCDACEHAADIVSTIILKNIVSESEGAPREEERNRRGPPFTRSAGLVFISDRFAG